MRNFNKIVRKSDGKRPLGKSRDELMDNIKLD
jgi:hypothetical protein